MENWIKFMENNHNYKIQSMFDLFFDLDNNQDLQNLKKYILNNKEILDKGFIFTGVGKNWYICEKLNKTFLSMGLKSQSLDPVHALHGDLGMVDGQIIFFISKSGNTEELIRLAKILRALVLKGIKKCIMVGFCLNNQFENTIYDYMIMPSEKYPKTNIYEFDNRNLIPSLSINIMQMVLDKFGVDIFESIPELVENYKWNHLAGENGRRLGVNKILEDLTK